MVLEVVTIAAVFLGPVAAVQAQKFIEKRGLQRRRKDDLFKTLMESRGSQIAQRHVRALNLIDLEFLKDRRIINAWNTYRDHLSNPPDGPGEAKWLQWQDRAADCLTKLLSEMGASLGYDFDEVTYRKGAYVPQPYFSIDEENTFIRQQFVRVLRGEAALPMRMVSTVDDQTASQKATEQLVGIMVEAMAEKFGPPAHESEGEDSGSDASAPKN